MHVVLAFSLHSLPCCPPLTSQILMIPRGWTVAAKKISCLNFPLWAAGFANIPSCCFSESTTALRPMPHFRWAAAQVMPEHCIGTNEAHQGEV